MSAQDREPIYHDHAPPPSTGRGFYRQGQVMHIRRGELPSLPPAPLRLLGSPGSGAAHGAACALSPPGGAAGRASSISTGRTSTGRLSSGRRRAALRLVVDVHLSLFSRRISSARWLCRRLRCSSRPTRRRSCSSDLRGWCGWWWTAPAASASSRSGGTAAFPFSSSHRVPHLSQDESWERANRGGRTVDDMFFFPGS